MRNLGLILALWLAALLPTSSLALGLGEIQVNSFLNQPLDAEIEVISARPGEIDDLLVSLASSEAFTRAGLARPRHLSELRFSVRKNEEGDQAVIVVSTKAGVKEPFLNFLIEADWSKGRVLREFTILLDPPFYADQPAPVESVVEPVEQAAVDEATVSEIEATVSEIVEQSGLTSSVETSEPAESVAGVTEPIALAEDTSQPVIPEPVPEPVSGGYIDETTNVTQGDVLVVKGDTLWSIASRYKDDDHTMSQVMLAFQRANPGAFNDGNINSMKAGAILRVPGADEMDGLGQQEAYAEVLVQNGLWDEYVARVTGVTPAVASEDAGPEAVAQEDTAAAESGELSLLMPGDAESESTGTGDADVDALRTKLALAEEELEASRIENQELESRITELQARLSKLEELQKMVEIEDDSLAQLQADQVQEIPDGESEEIVSEEPVTEEAVTEETMTDDVISETIAADEEALLEELLAEEAAAQAEEQATQQASDIPDGESEESVEESVTETMTTEQAADGMVDDEVQEEAAVTPPAPVIVTQPTRAPSIFDGLLPPDVIDMIPSMDSIIGDPIILAAIGGVILLLIILYFLKKRKGSTDEETSIVAGDDDDLFTGYDEEDELTPIHLVDGGESEETDIHAPGADELAPAEPAEEVVAEVEAPVDAEPQEDPGAAIESADTEMLEPEAPTAATAEQDDVLNEVDVYLAYGLYDNAEELLNNSLTEQPERADYRSKLLDTYFATKNAEAFVKEAGNLKSMGDAANSYWDRVQIMGYELAPDNALFSDAKDSGLSAADLEISKPQEADFDLGSADDTTNFSTTDFNLGEDDTGGDFSDSGSLGEAGQIAATQVLQQVGELPELDDEDDTNLRGEAEPQSDELELPEDIGDELEFSIDEAAADSGAESERPAASDEIDLDDISMDFDVDEDAAAEAEDNSEIDFETEFDAGLEEGDGLDLDEAAAGTGELELDTSEKGEEEYTETAVITPNYEDTEVVPDLRSAAAAEDEPDFGTDDTAIIDLDETSLETGELNLETAELNLETAELNLDTGELDLPGEEEDDDDEDISIIDFGGEDFVEPTDIVESIAEGDDDESEDVKTGTFAPGDFEEPTAAVDSISDIDDISDLMLPDDVDEVSTKLDLARAFIDMGDTEGARGSLEEVIAEGNDDQKTEAKALLDQI